MFNPVIVLAIIIQIIISRFSRIAGAIFGYIITTGILIWGISVYAEGDQIALFGIPLSQTIFLIACLVWYGFDTWEFMAIRREESALKEALNSPLMQDQRVVQFYQRTIDTWASDKLSTLNKGLKNEGKLSYEKFVKKYLPIKGNALFVFLTNYPPREGEYLVAFGDSNSSSNRGWYVLTNLRLIQKDGRDKSFKEVPLSEIDTFKIKGTLNKSLSFNMKSGETIDFEKIEMFPSDKFINELIK